MNKSMLLTAIVAVMSVVACSRSNDVVEAAKTPRKKVVGYSSFDANLQDGPWLNDKCEILQAPPQALSTRDSVEFKDGAILVGKVSYASPNCTGQSSATEPKLLWNYEVEAILKDGTAPVQTFEMKSVPTDKPVPQYRVNKYHYAMQIDGDKLGVFESKETEFFGKTSYFTRAK